VEMAERWLAPVLAYER